MTNYILGKDLLDRWKIKSFELFQHVKNGLQPHNKFGKPKAPPDIELKIKTLSDLKKELPQAKFAWLRLSAKERKSLAKKYRSEGGYITNQSPFFRAVLGPSLESERWIPRYKKITKEIKVLENELAKIDNKYSWGDYELPEDTGQAEWVINSLLGAYYKLTDVAEIEKEETKQSDENFQPVERVPSSGPRGSRTMRAAEEQQMEKNKLLRSEQLMKRWGIDDLTLAGLVYKSELWAYYDWGSWYEPVLDYKVKSPRIKVLVSPLYNWTVDTIRNNLDFLIFDIEDVTQHPRDQLKNLHPQGENLNSSTEKQVEEFIRKLRVSVECDTDISFKPFKRQGKTFSHAAIGFQYSTSKEWEALREIVRNGEFNCGKAAYRKYEGGKKDRVKFYDQNQKILQRINKKLLVFLAKTYEIDFPEKYKIFEQLPNDPPRIYRPKFQTDRKDDWKEVE